MYLDTLSELGHTGFAAPYGGGWGSDLSSDIGTVCAKDIYKPVDNVCRDPLVLVDNLTCWQGEACL